MIKPSAIQPLPADPRIDRAALLRNTRLILPSKLKKLLNLTPAQQRMGTLIVGKRGVRKTSLQALFALYNLWRRIPQILIDPTGTLIHYLLGFLSSPTMPPELRAMLLDRIIYCEQSGRWSDEYVTPWPLYKRYGNQSFAEAAMRPLLAFKLQDRHLQEAPSRGWRPLVKLGKYVGICLQAMDCQITEALDLITYPNKYGAALRKARQQYGDQRDVCEAVDWLLDVFAPAGSSSHSKQSSQTKRITNQERQLLTYSFENMLSVVVDDNRSAAMFGASQPAFTVEQITAEGKTVILDYQHETNKERLSFKFPAKFVEIREAIHERSSIERTSPLGVIIDELSLFFTFDPQRGGGPVVQELNYLINVLSRSKDLWLNVSLQDIFQVDEDTRNVVQSLGTLFLGATTSSKSARIWAEELYRTNPYLEKEPLFTYLNTGLAFEPVRNGAIYFTPEEQYLHYTKYLLDSFGEGQFLNRSVLGEGDRYGPLDRVDLAKVLQGMHSADTTEMRGDLLKESAVRIDDVLQATEQRKRRLLEGEVLVIRPAQKPLKTAAKQLPEPAKKQPSVSALPPSNKLLEMADAVWDQVTARPPDYWPEP